MHLLGLEPGIICRLSDVTESDILCDVGYLYYSEVDKTNFNELL